MILPETIVYKSSKQALQEWQTPNGTWIVGYVPYMVATHESKDIAEKRVMQMLVDYDIIKGEK
jgi:hypothetical protein